MSTPFYRTLFRVSRAMENAGYAERTIENYSLWIERFLRYCKGGPVEKISWADAAEYLNVIRPIYSKSTVTTARSALRFLFALLGRNLDQIGGRISHQRRAGLATERPKDEIRRLMEAIQDVRQGLHPAHARAEIEDIDNAYLPNLQRLLDGLPVDSRKGEPVQRWLEGSDTYGLNSYLIRRRRVERALAGGDES